MKDEIKVFGAVMLAVFIAVAAALLVIRPASVTKFGDAVAGYPLLSTTSGSVSLPTGTSTVVSLPDTARAYGYLCNTDTSANDYLGFSNYTSTATSSSAAIGYATTTAGVVIFPKTCYELASPKNNLWAQINATTASTATTTLLYMFGH